MRPDGVRPGPVGLRDGDGAALFGLPGSASGPQSEITVLGPEQVLVVGSHGVLEGQVRVADGRVGPPAGPGVQVGPVGFGLGDLVADTGDLVRDVGRDQPGEPVPFAGQVGDIPLDAGDVLGAFGDPLLAALLVPGPGE